MHRPPPDYLKSIYREMHHSPSAIRENQQNLDKEHRLELDKDQFPNNEIHYY